jgi:hypothetical protein
MAAAWLPPGDTVFGTDKPSEHERQFSANERVWHGTGARAALTCLA